MSSFFPTGGGSGTTAWSDINASAKTGSVGAIIQRELDIATWPGVTLGAVSAGTRIANYTAIQAALNYASANGLGVYFSPGRYEYTSTAPSITPAAWATSTAYVYGQYVTQSSNIYACLVAHTSGTFATDLGAGKWVQVSSPQGVGLQIRPGTGDVRGVRGRSLILQYGTHEPVLTLSDIHGFGAITDTTISGLSLGYGVDHTGTGSDRACALQVGAMGFSVIHDIFVMAGDLNAVYRPYDAMRFYNSSIGFFASNSVRDVHLYAATHSYWVMDVSGTGNLWQNIYCADGFRNTIDMTGPAIEFGWKRYIQMKEQVFDTINVEWSNVNTCFSAYGLRRATIRGLHLEANQMIGSNPAMIVLGDSEVTFEGGVWEDNQFKTGTPAPLNGVMTGSNARVFSILDDAGTGQGSDRSVLAVKNVAIDWNANGDNSRVCNTRVKVIDYTPTTSFRADLSLEGVTFTGHTAGLDLDSTLPGGTFGEVTHVARYAYDSSLSRTWGARIVVPGGAGGTVNAYGAHQNAKHYLDSPITGTKVLKMNKALAPSGYGSTANTTEGSEALVVRSALATGAFAFNIQNSAGTQIHTMSASGSNQAKKLLQTSSDWTAP